MEGVGAVALGAAVGGMVEGGVEDMAEGPGEATGVAEVGGMGVAARMEQHHPGRLCLQASVPPHPCTAWTQGEPERQQLHLSSHAAVLLLWCPCPVGSRWPHQRTHAWEHSWLLWREQADGVPVQVRQLKRQGQGPRQLQVQG